MTLLLGDWLRAAAELSGLIPTDEWVSTFRLKTARVGWLNGEYEWGTHI